MSRYKRQVNEWLAVIASGDMAAFKEFFDFTYESLRKVAMRYLRDRSEIEDVMETVYLHIFQAKTFDAGKDGYNWLCRIVQNVARDFNNARPRTVELEKAEKRAEFRADATELAQRRLEREEIRKELKKLSPRERKLLKYRFGEEYTYAQIAEKTKMSRSTACDAVAGAVKKLRDLYGEE